MIKIPKKINKYPILLKQQRLIQDHYDFLRCSVNKNVLICTGWIIQPDCESYRIKIEYAVGYEPKSTILSPLIDPSKKIHMYNDRSLCLSYPPDMKWNEKTEIFRFTIPWIAKWIIYYEIFKGNGGEWEGPESPVHFKESERNRNKDRAFI